MQIGVGGVRFSGKKRYEGVRFNVISVTRGWVGVQFPEKKRYVTLESGPIPVWKNAWMITFRIVRLRLFAIAVIEEAISLAIMTILTLIW